MVLTQEIIQRGIQDCRAVTCDQLHGGNCNFKFVQQFLSGCQSLYKLYLIVHFLPAVLFKTKKFRQHFMGELKHTLLGFLRSMLFAGLFPAFSRRIMCFITQFYGFEGNLIGVASGIGALSLLFQPKSRQSEIALTLTTKTIEIIHGYMNKHGIHLHINNFNVWLFGLIMAVFGYFYQHEPSTMRRNYHTAFAKVIGNV